MLTRLRAALLRWVLSTMKDAHHVSGFRVVVENRARDVETPTLLSRLDVSLQWIERYQPWRLRNMRRDFRQILIGPLPRRGSYLVETGTCVIDLGFLAGPDSSPAMVASTLIHEGMHARIARRGIAYNGPTKARQERICVRAQMEFGRSLPKESGASVVEGALRQLASEDEEITRAISWTDMKRRYFENA
jgi:hypothetical protein